MPTQQSRLTGGRVTGIRGGPAGAGARVDQKAGEIGAGGEMVGYDRNPPA